MNINFIIKGNIIIRFSRILKVTLTYILKVINIKGINLCLTTKVKILHLIQWLKIGILKIKKRFKLI